MLLSFILNSALPRYNEQRVTLSKNRNVSTFSYFDIEMETANHVQNVAEYDLYTNISFEGKNDEEIKSCLLDYLDSCMANISPFLVDYIWQRDSFHLTPVIPVATG